MRSVRSTVVLDWEPYQHGWVYVVGEGLTCHVDNYQKGAGGEWGYRLVRTDDVDTKHVHRGLVGAYAAALSKTKRYTPIGYSDEVSEKDALAVAGTMLFHDLAYLASE